MKTRIKNLNDCMKLFQVEIPHDLVEKTAKEVYGEIKKVAKIPGFRVGSAPQDLLEKHYSKNAEEEILKKLIPAGYRKALDDHRADPIGPPRVFNINFQKGKPLIFEAEVATRPVFKLKNYKGIKVTKKRISVSQQETDESFSRLRNMYSKYNDLQGPVKKGDYVVCDVEVFANGKPISKKNKSMWISADKNASLLGMGEDLIGLAKGQTKEIKKKLPDNYPDKKYAGKLAKFKILVNEIKEKKLPTVDDEFAKNLNSDNLETLKKEVESQLLMRKENALKINMQNQILERLLKDVRFQVPAGLVGRQKEVFVRRLETELLQKGLHKDDIEKKIKELDPKLEQNARDKVQLYFILDYIAVKEKIELNEKDINERLKAIAMSLEQSADEVKKYYEKEKLLGGLAEEIKEGKVLEFLLKEAEIKEGG